jgi:ribonuclease P protein component
LTGREARSRGGVLRQPGQFEAVLKSGIRVSSRNFVARALANGVLQPRLGMIAGKKAAPRAVDRNRVKRLIREIFRATGEKIGAYDVTIQLRSDLRAAQNSAIRAELQDLLGSLGRRCMTASSSAARAALAVLPSSDRQ